MAEGAQRLASLVVVGGPLKDRRLDLEEVVTEVLIGSDGDCHLQVDLPGISPIHARIWAELDGAVAHDTHAPRGLFVNDDKVEGEAPVKNGDWLWLGPPGDPGSVCIQCHFEEWVEVLPEAGGAGGPSKAPAAPVEDDEAPIPVVPIDAYEPVTPIGDGAPEAPAPEGFEPTAAPLAPSAPGEFEPNAEAGAPEGFEPTTAESAPPEPVSFEPPTSEPASPEPVSFEPVSPEPASPEPVSFEPTAPEPASPEPVSAEPPAPEPPPASAAVPPPPPPAPPAAPAPPPPATPAESEDAHFVEAEPPTDDVVASPGAPPPPPVAATDGPSPEDDAFFVEAEPEPVMPPASGDTPAATPGPADAPAPPPPPPPPAPPSPGGGDPSDPFFVGESEDAPGAGAEASSSGAPAEDHFFIAGDALTGDAVPTEVSAPADANEELMAVEAEPIVSPEEALPEPEALDRAPLPPLQGASPVEAEPIPTAEVLPEALPEPPAPASPPPPPPSAPVLEATADEEILAAEPLPESAEDETVAAVESQSPEEPQSSGEPSPDAAVHREAPPVERPRPASARRGPAPAGRRPGRRRPKGGPPAWVKPVGLGAGLALIVGVVAIGLVSWLGRTVSVKEISPSRARVGQRATLTGEGFSTRAAENTVLFGDATARVLEATATRLEVAVPEAVAEAGTERTVTVTVRVGDRSSEPVEISVFQGPRLHGLSPDVAMPGDEVVLAGAGWGIGASVRFGEYPAEILEIESTQIRVVVPQIEGYGTLAPAIVSVGGVDSNAAPFYIGRLPLVTGVTPRSVRPGDRFTLSGRGLSPDPSGNGVRIDGRLALIVAARSDELEVVAPRLPPGEPTRPLEVHVAGTEEPGQSILDVAAPADPLELRFVAEPFDQESARTLAVVATDLGPAFVLAAANGRTAAERAAEAQDRLNAAVATIASSPGLVPEVRDLTTRPSIALAGQPEPLLEVTEADAAAYNEDWTGLRGRGGPVTPARLARWWEAVTRDLILMLVRGERPQFAAALAPEGRVLQQVFDAGPGGGGIPRQVVSGASSAVRTGLRRVGLRVPASVTAEVPPAAGQAAPAAAPTPRPRPLALEGQWSGSEVEQGRRRYLTVTFRRNRGSIAYEGGITLTVPFLSMERPGRNEVRFSVEMRGGVRHYSGRWDGEMLKGDIARDAAGRNVVGTFELRPR